MARMAQRRETHLSRSEIAAEALRQFDRGESPSIRSLAAALATRRAFGHHPQVALHIAATPAANDQLAANLGLVAAAFEGLGLHGEAAARAFHAYGSFANGSTLVLAARLNLATPDPGPRPEPSPAPNDDTRASLEAMVDISYSDPVRDEELFVDGLRRLIDSFA